MNIIWNIPPKLSGWIALDLELVNTNVKVLHRPQGGDFALLTLCNEKNVWVINNEVDVPSVISNIQDCVWVFHNAKFDLTHLRRWSHIPPRSRIWDTMLIDKILWSGYYDAFGLADLARRYLDRHLDKTLQDKWNDVDPKDIPEEFKLYAINDVVTTFQVAMEQKKQVKKSHFWIWQNIDLPAMWAVMDFQGFRIDADKWRALADKNKQKANEIKASLPFNPSSPKIAREYLSKRGFRGLSNTQESTLETWINRYHDTEAAELAKVCLESRKYAKRASTYGKAFIENYLEQDLVHKVDVIFGDYNIIGAETGRLSCTSPNMQNIPSKDTHEFRECFIARPGYKLVIADYSQQEIGIVAFLSEDKRLMDIFNSGKDIYIQMHKLMYGKTITKDDPLRKRMKSVVLGGNYGQSAYGLALKEKITEDEAQEFMDKRDRVFNGLASWMQTQRKKRIFTTTILGRKTWLNPYLSQSERNALNNPIQGSAADMMKLALIEMHKNWKFECRFPVVACVHDEIVLDVPEKYVDEVKKYVEDATIKAANQMCKGMNFRVDVSVGDNWSEK